MIVLTGGFAVGGGPPLPTQTDIAVFQGIVLVLALLVLVFVLMILWGAASYWVDFFTRNDRVRVRPPQ